MHEFPRQTVAERHGRRVGRLRVRTSDASAQLTVQTILEEALRLTTLPGEDQGRVYVFRRLQLPSVDLRAKAPEWIDRCSTRLLEMGARAIHASVPGAARADAVFFSDAQEPWRLLSARLLRADAAAEWFWSSATGVDGSLPRSVRLEQVFDWWHVQPGGWSTVAREFLPVLDPQPAEELLATITPAAARRWLAGMGAGTQPGATRLPVPTVRSRSRALLRHLRPLFADRDPRVLFLAALAVLECSAAPVQRGGLEDLAAIVIDDSLPASESSDWRRRFDKARQSSDSRASSVPSTRTRIHAESIAPSGSTGDGTAAPAPGSSARPDHDRSGRLAGTPLSESAVRLERLTSFAGLYFLLQPLRHLGIAEAIDAYPELERTRFVARILLRLSANAGLEPDDPVLLPIAEDLSDAMPFTIDPVVRPRTFVRLRRLKSSPDLSERLWAAAVRQWCRRFAGMHVDEIAARPGRVHVTPTSIDVVMPMSAVDVRIRRCGLDIDPGYLPWIGRVVHFHYHAEVSSPW